MYNIVQRFYTLPDNLLKLNFIQIGFYHFEKYVSYILKRLMFNITWTQKAFSSIYMMPQPISSKYIFVSEPFRLHHQ